ncbi:MAG: hypothetical protein WD696_14265 [Bryobacteraceae bacterium]
MSSDEVSALRAAEQEIDATYTNNPLLNENLGTALWVLLTFVEDLELRPYAQRRTPPPHQRAALIDETLNALKYAVGWIFGQCRSGSLRRRYDPVSYQGAWDLIELARRYYGFSAPFQYWSRGELGLRLEGTRIIAELDFTEAAEYEAYNRLMSYHEGEEAPPEAESLIAKIDARVRVEGKRFTVSVNPQIVGAVMASAESFFMKRFTLPECWKFSRYSLREFRLVYLTMYHCCPN